MLFRSDESSAAARDAASEQSGVDVNEGVVVSNPEREIDNASINRIFESEKARIQEKRQHEAEAGVTAPAEAAPAPAPKESVAPAVEEPVAAPEPAPAPVAAEPAPAPVMHFCRFCGKPIPSDSAFCNHCGKDVR